LEVTVTDQIELPPKDLTFTTNGSPKLVLGEESYPVIFTIMGMKEFAEYKGISFEAMLSDGWSAEEQSPDDLMTLLRIALEGGQRRKAAFNGGEKKDITPEMLDLVADLIHPTELIVLLVRAWNQPPVVRVDPQSQESPQTGE
jgi:hypothetical protein